MNSKKTIFDFFEQVFFLFGVTVVILIVLSMIFGDGAKEISSMFSMGSSGLSVEIMIQFLVISFLITGIRFFYFNDKIMKKASITIRTALMLLSIIAIIVIFICSFGWFPVQMWQPWVMFAISFGICFVTSMAVTYLKEKIDNKNMELALQKLKEEVK